MSCTIQPENHYKPSLLAAHNKAFPQRVPSRCMSVNMRVYRNEEESGSIMQCLQQLIPKMILG